MAEVGETIKAPNGESDARLRVIYANGTESNLLRRSLQRALYKDETGHRLGNPGVGPLFGDAPESDDIETGTIYVLRSLPFAGPSRQPSAVIASPWIHSESSSPLLDMDMQIIMTRICMA